MQHSEKLRNIELEIGYCFRKHLFLQNALRHSSVKQTEPSFERLEFLGDRILSLVIAEYLYKNFSRANEGLLAKMQSAFVCADACYKIALQIGIPEVIQISSANLQKNKTVLADAMESIIAAIFLDSDFVIVQKIILHLWQNIFNTYDHIAADPKTKLQEITQATNGKIPHYELISVDGPDHALFFSVSLTTLGQTVCGHGKSRKLAEIDAARKLLQLSEKYKV